MSFGVDGRTGGLALVIGYLLLVVALYSASTGGLAAATASIRGVVFFLVLPAIGLASGVYAFLGGPLAGGIVVVTATYLGAVGVALAVPFTPVSTPIHLLGLGLFALAVVALVGTGKRLLATLLPGGDPL